MRIGFPVIFMRDGVEYAGVVSKSSPRKNQVPLDDPSGRNLTQEQRFNELRCSIAFWHADVREWLQAEDVPYLPIDVALPERGDFYSEVGAPDPAERLELKAAQAEHAAKMEEGRRAFLALPPEEQERIRKQNQEWAEKQAREQLRNDGMAAGDARSPDPIDEPEPKVAGAGV